MTRAVNTAIMPAPPKTLLAIDCSFGGHSVALVRNQQILAQCHHPRVVASQGLIASIERLRRAANIELNTLDYIAFGAGPGLFSGIRAACTATQGLAFVLATPVVPVPTPLALAHACCTKRALVAYRAYQGHCYIAAYERSKHNWRELLKPTLCPQNELPSLSGNWELCGRRLATLQSACKRACSGTVQRLPSWRSSLAPTVALLGMKLAAAGKTVTAVQALPHYVRHKVAYTKEERKAMQHSQ